jgi:KaiC/GvpD/RAD55 family RecA-like ATPase/predicted hydrocarbon binding protein
MEKRGLSLAEIQELPRESLTLVVGPPGTGKSTFCREIVLNGIAAEKPVIFITTEQSSSAIAALLREKGMGEVTPGALGFVDAFAQTVGLAVSERPDSISANCVDLNSISMATTRLQERIGRKDIVLAFDSLTSPYLFSGVEVTKFMRLFLSKFAAEGNSVVALIDEGCGKEEDLGAMMSVADSIIRMEIKENTRIINVVKHPKIAPTRVESPMTWSPVLTREKFDPKVLKEEVKAAFSGPGKKPLRTEVQDDFVNVFWRNLACWSGMLWDPKRFPTMAYELDREAHARTRESLTLLPWHMKLILKLFMPKSFSEVKDVKRLMPRMTKIGISHGYGTTQYIEEASRKDEHYFRVDECCSCWGFDNVGAGLGFHQCGEWAGIFMMLEKKERVWNMVETKCVGLGDPYCEFKFVPGPIGELKGYLEGIDSTIVAKVHDRLMEQLIGFLVHGKPLPERPTVGNRIMYEEMHHVTGVPALFSERYRVALRMGGTKAGKEVGEHIMEAGVAGDEAIKRVINFMEYCKVGKINSGETIRIWDNCESFGLDTGQPSCNFTTSFLNGLFSAVKNQRVREIKCIAAGDAYCEWEII